MTNKLTFKLISCCNTIMLPQPLNHIQHIKISKLLYKIISPSIYAIKLSIPSFNQHSFFNGQTTINYFFMLFNDGNSNNLINYQNIYNISDYSDSYPRGVNSITINITDDEENLLSEISEDNPLLIELEFY